MLPALALALAVAALVLDLPDGVWRLLLWSALLCERPQRLQQKVQLVMGEHHHLSVTHDWAATSSRRCHVSQVQCSSLVCK
jgi:hypothetical protein